MPKRRESFAQLLKADQVVDREKVIDVGEGSLHALGKRLVVGAAKQWVEPDESMTRALEACHFARE